MREVRRRIKHREPSYYWGGANGIALGLGFGMPLGADGSPFDTVGGIALDLGKALLEGGRPGFDSAARRVTWEGSLQWHLDARFCLAGHNKLGVNQQQSRFERGTRNVTA